MKNEPKVKKLVLMKETLRDLTAHNAGWVKGGPKGGKATNKCAPSGKPTCGGFTCNTGVTCLNTCAVCTGSGCASWWYCH